MKIQYHIIARGYYQDWDGEINLVELDTNKLESPIAISNESYCGAAPLSNASYDIWAMQHAFSLLTIKAEENKKEINEIEISIIGKERIE